MYRSRFLIGSIVFFAIVSFAANVVSAQHRDPDRPLWLRYPAVSPDGTQIAFSYGGQIWVMPSAGGEAVPLTGGPFFSTRPVWSPDSELIAFASYRHGNADVFVMSAKGGAITRLTHHSADDLPQAFSPSGDEVYFASSRLGDPTADALHAYQAIGAVLEQLYAVSSAGGRPRMVLPTPALDVRPSHQGTYMLYTDHRSTENEWRKHQVSDAARDIWLYDLNSNTHAKLTKHRGEDRNAVWEQDGASFVWLSERSGSFNVWRRQLNGEEAVQLTFHEKSPVRFLSSSLEGLLVYGWDGEIWRLLPGSSAPKRVAVRIRQGSLLQGEVFKQVNGETTEIAISPKRDEIALIARGDVFVVSGESGATRRITSTPAAERHVSFAPDGRGLLYAGERDGNWDIFQASLRHPEDKGFSGATPFTEVELIGGDSDVFQPVYDPDGRRVAYREDRNTIRVFDIESGDTVEVLSKDAVYSYFDDDLKFAWSPDGRWLVARTGFEIGNSEIELIDVVGREPRRNISRSGYMDLLPSVSADGTMVLWLSDRDGLRAADSSIAELDVYAAYLGNLATDAFNSALSPEVDGLERRTYRQTPFSIRPLFYKLTPDNQRLILVAEQPDGIIAGHAVDLVTWQVELLFSRQNAEDPIFAADDEVAFLYTLGDLGIDRYDLATGDMTTILFKAEIARDPPREVAYIFDHAWQLTQAKFYDPNMHGVDWSEVGEHYKKFLPHIRHWEELAELLSEMAGELNASHQGALYAADTSTGDDTGALGIYYDDAWRDDGMRVAEVLQSGPADDLDSMLTPGAVILAVDDVSIRRDSDIHRLLNRKAGKTVLLTIRPADSSTPVEEFLTPVSRGDEFRLAYERWVDKRRAIVDRLSAARIGYLHLAEMNLSSYQRAFSELFGRYAQAEAVVVDIRFNSGGNLHDQLITMLTGEQVNSMVTRDGVRLGTSSATRWAKPSAVVANADSYSDGSIFPALYQKLGIGAVIGERVPGTGTAVWWEQQLEPRLTYGVPQLGFQLNDGSWFENREIVPDILVENDPSSMAVGRDLQLERAVAYLLETLDGEKPN